MHVFVTESLKTWDLTAIDKKKKRRAEREIREMGRSAQRAGGGDRDSRREKH